MIKSLLTPVMKYQYSTLDSERISNMIHNYFFHPTSAFTLARKVKTNSYTCHEYNIQARKMSESIFQSSDTLDSRRKAELIAQKVLSHTSLEELLFRFDGSYNFPCREKKNVIGICP